MSWNEAISSFNNVVPLRAQPAIKKSLTVVLRIPKLSVETPSG
jgi:hypothetical protein